MSNFKLRLRYVIVDWVSTSVAWLLFNILRYYEAAVYQGFSSLSDFLLSNRVLTGQILFPLLWFAIHWLSGYYNKPSGKSRLVEFFTTLSSVFLGVLILFFCVVLNEIPETFDTFYRYFFALLVLQFFFTYIPRLLITSLVRKKASKHTEEVKVTVIGTGKSAQSLGKELNRMGYAVVGYIAVEEPADAIVLNAPILGSIEKMEELIRNSDPDELMIALDNKSNEDMVKILYSLYPYKKPLKILASSVTVFAKRARVGSFYGIPLIDVSDNNFSEAEKNIKRAFDVFISIVVLILLAPFFPFIAFRIKKNSPGSIFYYQERIGYRGKPFMMYKFRTMERNAEFQGPRLSKKNDRRITSFGRFMRKYRIDELPQFWNILKGDMSLVGPRPERKYFIDQIVKKAPYYYLLHNVKPGITSWGMVKYGYAENIEEMIERLQFDMLYYENMSLILDLTILAYTVRTVLTGKGV